MVVSAGNIVFCAVVHEQLFVHGGVIRSRRELFLEFGNLGRGKSNEPFAPGVGLLPLSGVSFRQLGHRWADQARVPASGFRIR